MQVSDDEARELIAMNLARLRGEMSYSELGRRCGSSAGAVRDIETMRRMPGAGMLTRLADALEVDISELLKAKKLPAANRKKASA